MTMRPPTTREANLSQQVAPQPSFMGGPAADTNGTTAAAAKASLTRS